MLGIDQIAALSRAISGFIPRGNDFAVVGNLLFLVMKHLDGAFDQFIGGLIAPTLGIPFE